MNETVLELRGVSVAVGDRPVLDDIDLSVARGRCLALVGETGSGKSMTCRVITGQLERIGARVTAGSVRLDDLDLLSCTRTTWRRLRGRVVASVPQSSMSSLNPVRSVGGQLRETVRELDGQADPQARARELLELVRIRQVDRVLSSYPHQLSGGMRQRVMIALALVGHPRLLVADEPTTALDVTVQREIMELVDGLRRDIGLGLVLVTHDLGLASTIADEVMVMYQGSTVEHGPAQKILHDPEEPYTRALLAARPSARTRGSRLGIVEGAAR